MLTDTAIRAAKPRDRRYKLSDSGGLQLHVMPHGSRLWRLAYRFNGKQRELSIGVHPAVGLAAARAARAYNAAEYLDDRRAMMQRWADHLEGLKSRKS